jgi:tetratricopeptide (TPR) repeat protein
VHPDRYAQHDAYVGLLAAVYSGDAQRVAVWQQRYKAFADPTPMFSLTSPRPDMIAIVNAQRDESAGKIDAAATQLQNAISYQRETFTSEFVPVYPADERLGALYFRAGRFDDANAAFADALRRRPSDPRLLFGMAQTLIKQGRADEAATYSAKFQTTWAGGPISMSDF